MQRFIMIHTVYQSDINFRHINVVRCTFFNYYDEYCYLVDKVSEYVGYSLNVNTVEP